MNLIDAIVNINPDGNWGIWAEYPFVENSHSRYGQRQFENGGLLDDLRYFSNGRDVHHFLFAELDGIDKEKYADDIGWMTHEAAEDYIDIIMEEIAEDEENL